MTATAYDPTAAGSSSESTGPQEENLMDVTPGGVGRISRVIGPVVDVEFPGDAMPDQYNLLTTTVEIAGEQRILDNDADYVDPFDMLAELRDDNNELVGWMRELHELCDDHNDVATASLLSLAMSASAQDTPASVAGKPVALVIHGGAGVIERDALSAADEKAIRADLDRVEQLLTSVRQNLLTTREWFRPFNDAAFGMVAWYRGEFDEALDKLRFAAESRSERGATGAGGSSGTSNQPS